MIIRDIRFQRDKEKYFSTKSRSCLESGKSSYNPIRLTVVYQSWSILPQSVKKTYSHIPKVFLRNKEKISKEIKLKNAGDGKDELGKLRTVSLKSSQFQKLSLKQKIKVWKRENHETTHTKKTRDEMPNYFSTFSLLYNKTEL